MAGEHPWHFRVYLDLDECLDDAADALYEAGCDDALLVRQAGVTLLDFTRRTRTWEAAVSSAIEDVRRAGVTPTSIRVEA